jgi:conjugal transfer pilus assembly protein TraF
MKSILMVLCVLSIATLSYANTGQNSFWERKAEGWFWYQRTPEPPKKTEPPKPEKKKDSVVVISPQKPIEPSEPELAGPAPMSAAWLEENLPKYLETALDDPSQENITAYLYLQRLAVDKSQRFADGAQAAIIADPLLDESTRRPLATFGAKNATAESHHYTRQLLTDLGKDVGVWLFFKSDCPYSDSQAAVQKMLENEYGIHTFAISLDGKGLPSGAFPQFAIDQGQSKDLQVVQTPALFLANPKTNQVVPIGQGNLAHDEMKKRILIASTAVGWLSPEDFAKSRPANGPVLDPNSLQDVTEDEIKDPQRVIEILRTRLSQSGGY